MSFQLDPRLSDPNRIPGHIANRQSLEMEANALRWLQGQVREKKVERNIPANERLPEEAWRDLAQEMTEEQQKHQNGGMLFNESPWFAVNYSQMIRDFEINFKTGIFDKMSPFTDDMVAYGKYFAATVIQLMNEQGVSDPQYAGNPVETAQKLSADYTALQMTINFAFANGLLRQAA